MLIDLHSHSILSDGIPTIQGMVAAADRQVYVSARHSHHWGGRGTGTPQAVRLRRSLDPWLRHTRHGIGRDRGVFLGAVLDALLRKRAPLSVRILLCECWDPLLRDCRGCRTIRTRQSPHAIAGVGPDRTFLLLAAARNASRRTSLRALIRERDTRAPSRPLTSRSFLLHRICM